MLFRSIGAGLSGMGFAFRMASKKYQVTVFAVSYTHLDVYKRQAITDVLWYMFLSASTGIYELLPGFIVGLLLAVIVSLIDKAPSQEVLDIYDRATDKKSDY